MTRQITDTLIIAERNLAAADGEGLGAVPVDIVRRHRWVRNFYR